MTRHEDRTRIQHALDAARRIVSSTAGWTRDRLQTDDLETLGLIRLLEVLGEAAGSVSSATRQDHPDLPWRQMTALRNRLVHGYFDIDLQIVWDTARSDVPALVPQLERVLADLDERAGSGH
jgi:uncharacterized protein with HEPN domain